MTVQHSTRDNGTRRARTVAPVYLLGRTGLIALCLGALTACEYKAGASWYDDHSKPGASRQQTTAAVNECRQEIQQTRGAAATRSAAMGRQRMEDCLRQRGYSKRRGPSGR